MNNTLVIYGSGSSLNNLSNYEKKKLDKMDSVSINLFIKTKIPLKYYILGEGLSWLLYNYYNTKDIALKNLLKKEYDTYIAILKTNYKDTKILFIDNYSSNMSFLNKYLKIILSDLKDMENIQIYNCLNDISNYNLHKSNELYHSGCGINCAINFAIQNKYKNIIFVGIDMYDSKYAYNSINNKLLNKKAEQIHSTKNSIFNHISKTKHLINYFVHNKQSLLTNIIPIIDL